MQRATGERVGRLIARLVERADLEPDRWLSALCDLFEREWPGEARCVAVTLAGEEPPWWGDAAALPVGEVPPLRAAAQGAGGHCSGPASAWHAEQVSRGFPADDCTWFARHPSPVRWRDGGSTESGVASRRDIVPDGVWRSSVLARESATRGLHEFVRGAAAMPGGVTERLLVMQIHCAEPGVQPRPDMADLLKGALPAVAAAYWSAFLRVRDHQRGLLDELSASQRAVVLLLLDGLSEAQVARRLSRSHHTVHDHTRAIYAAWGVSSRLQLRDRWFDRPLCGLEADPEADPASGRGSGSG